MPDNNGKLASNNFLFIAHPGHELCVHAWLEATRPRVFVLTDGSGNGGSPRLDSSRKVLESVGATIGSVYGRFKDSELYQIILDREYEQLFAVVDEFAEAIVAESIDAVAGDAIEGFNPAHDTCRLIINAAVQIARRRSGRQILNRDFLLAGRHIAPNDDDGAFWLDDAMLNKKVATAYAFPELRSEVEAALSGELFALRQYPELADESAVTYNTGGIESYRLECFRYVDEIASGSEFADAVPFYEQYGALRVTEGRYQRVIRYRQHMLPLCEALRNYADNC